ncbi:MAG: osmoprotectant transport system ATP-binding protein [Sphingomonadales bacterium]|nr:osmoprotectant transport system ATP-binding protein [Sphingomonadales bacterium]
MDSAPLLQLNGITKRHGADAALAGVSLAVPAGTLLALVGPSGSGKTTLLKTINRLVEPDEGSVVLAGEDVRAIPAASLRRRIGYVFQGIGLFPHLDVAENIAIVPRLTGAGAAERRARALELLDLVALPRDFASRYPAALSGGQAQRVGVARALAAEPSLMLMDEPFGALDPVTRDELGRAYRALHERLGLTTIMVTHDMAEALLLADRIVVLIDGRIRADGPPASLLRGDGDAGVRALIEVPRRQAERLAALERGG